MRRVALVVAIALGVALGITGPRAWAQPQPGDIVVVDLHAGTGGKGAVFVVNPITGMRRLLSDFGSAGQGPLGVQPFGITIGQNGNFFVTDLKAGTDCGFGTGCGAVFSVDRITGARALISDFGVPAQGPTGISPSGLTEEGGRLLVADPHARFDIITQSSGVLFSVDPASGARTIVSDFTNPAQGTLGGRPWSVAPSPSSLLVPAPFLSLLFGVDRGSGARTIVSDFTNAGQGPRGSAPIAATVDPLSSKILVLDQVAGAGPAGYGTLFSVDQGTGVRTVLSDFTTTAQGPIGNSPFDVKVSPDNQILVVDIDGGTGSLGAVFAVDRITGQRDCVSDFGSAAQGVLGNEPSGLVVVPGTRPPGLFTATAVLPSSRAVQVGSTATAFVTIINAGASVAKSVGIPLQGCRIPAIMSYQRTDPLTNALVGTPNTPVDIPPGGSQTFVIALTPTSPFPPTDVAFAFGGDNTARVAKLTGLNTLLLSGSATPVADVVALAATLGNDGIVNIPGESGTGVFSVATVNVGAGAPITVSADTGGVSLPVGIQLCQTNPATGACVSAIGPTVTTQIDAGATPTFAFFVIGGGTVGFDPAAHRVFVRFKRGNGDTVGATSVAVRTQ